MNTFAKLFIPMIYCLEKMKFNKDNTCNRDTSVKASSFFALVSTFQFVACLVLTRSVLDMTLSVTQLLQSRNIDICDGLHLIKSLKALLMARRQDVDEFHSKWYKKALTLSEKINITETMPRVVGTQIHRSNTPAESKSDYYKGTITIPLLHHLMCELYYRFDRSKIEAISNDFVIVPAKLIAIVQQPEKGHWKEKFSLFANFIRDDLPNALSLDSEPDLWETYWISYKGSLPDNVSNTLKSIKFSRFQNIKVALRIVGALPVTSCECKRSFSALRRLKTYIRSTMVAVRLNSLVLLPVQKDIIANIDKVIDLYAIKNRRLKFC